jgi:hypothetical protein
MVVVAFIRRWHTRERDRDARSEIPNGLLASVSQGNNASEVR